MRQEQSFPKEISSLEQVFDFLARFLDRERLEGDLAFSLNFVVEEIFTNMVKYNQSTRNEILVGVERADSSVVVDLTDFDVDPFDPETAPEVDVQAPLERRTPGGLGLHLVKSMVDKLSYEYRDRNLHVAMQKRIPA